MKAPTGNEMRYDPVVSVFNWSGKAHPYLISKEVSSSFGKPIFNWMKSLYFFMPVLPGITNAIRSKLSGLKGVVFGATQLNRSG